LTNDTIKDGWVYTGDIAVFDTLGRVRIVDRKKIMFKLSQGEYIVPDKLENGYGKSPYMQQLMIYGDSLQDFLVSVVVPELSQAEKWAKEAGIAYGSP